MVTQLSMDETGSKNKETVSVGKEDLQKIFEERETLTKNLHREELERVRLEERAKAAEPPAAPAVPVLTMDQLQKAVDDGQLTESQMKEEITRQLREQLRTELSDEMKKQHALSEQKKTLQQQFDRYVEFRPDIKVEGSDDLRRVHEEIEHLKTLGYAHNLQTELVALRQVFGPSDRVAETTRKTRESHRETGGGSVHTRSSGGSSSWEKGLSDSQVSTYRKLAEGAGYSGEDDPMFLRVTTRLRNKNSARGAA